VLDVAMATLVQQHAIELEKQQLRRMLRRLNVSSHMLIEPACYQINKIDHSR
jgi:hypothetical protein